MDVAAAPAYPNQLGERCGRIVDVLERVIRDNQIEGIGINGQAPTDVPLDEGE